MLQAIARHVDVLEIVDVTTSINRHIRVAAKYRKQALPHVATLILRLGGLCIYRMMPDHDDPIFLCGCESGIYP